MERGISLNSARSLLDHLSDTQTKIHPFYVDLEEQFYAISAAQLYANTPDDFDFKRAEVGVLLTWAQMVEKCSEMDIVFPVIHGAFGEDGRLQALFEAQNLPFVGSSAASCHRMFHKHLAATFLAEQGYPTLPSVLVQEGDPDNQARVAHFFEQHQLERAVIKPVAGGSSIGVSCVSSALEAIQQSQRWFEQKRGGTLLLEPFCTGKEFSVVVLQNDRGEPVALMPSEIQIEAGANALFDYRRKYLPTSNTYWFCPPRFDESVIQKIRTQAARLFRQFEMRDVARLDGWVLPDGRLLWTDFNPMSGMEQNSFIFQQASRVGLTHRDVLWHILACAGRRYGRHFTPPPIRKKTQSRDVYVLLGGVTAERQISVMSGTHVWLTLRRCAAYNASVYFFDPVSETEPLSGECIWRLPYTYALRHTVEEIRYHCKHTRATHKRFDRMGRMIQDQLQVSWIEGLDPALPTGLSVDAFLKQARLHHAFVWIALHGGIGEDGTIQQRLMEAGVAYNGSDALVSKECADKYETGKRIMAMNDPTITSLPKHRLQACTLKGYDRAQYETYWCALVVEMGGREPLLIKPQRDGCSAGIVVLQSALELERYMALLRRGVSVIPSDTFAMQPTPIEMPTNPFEAAYMVEPFWETDRLWIEDRRLEHRSISGWLELTVGVLEREGVCHALTPSITLAKTAVLRIEEKFQGGTGVNLTPPPASILSVAMCTNLRRQIARVAKALRIRHYARIDVFFNVRNGQLIVIEVNTLPGLTPSTVLYQQALAEQKAMSPSAFLQGVIEGFELLKKEGDTCQSLG